MRVAVTGAAGLVGRKTVEALKRAGWEVLPLSRAVRPGYLTTDYTVNSLAAIFADADAVSDWAVSSIGWAVEKGYLTGKPGNQLDPQGLATRAEATVVINRFLSE